MSLRIQYGSWCTKEKKNKCTDSSLYAGMKAYIYTYKLDLAVIRVPKHWAKMTVDQQLFVFIIIKAVHYYLSLFNFVLLHY